MSDLTAPRNATRLFDDLAAYQAWIANDGPEGGAHVTIVSVLPTKYGDQGVLVTYTHRIAGADDGKRQPSVHVGPLGRR